jgi:hypothetical protein
MYNRTGLAVTKELNVIITGLKRNCHHDLEINGRQEKDEK